jgi:predicted membrane-bound spermidine synthase
MRPLVVATSLLFGSGYCALVYQSVWFRDFRLVFGASTPSTAAVLALFMGGLGLGSFVLGSRAERWKNPLRAYAFLEGGILIGAALSPFILDGVRALYLGLGGSAKLGGVGATLVRLLLATLVIGGPAFLMGGTLPAIGRYVTSAQDLGRRGLALIYGANTLGAVAGVGTTTFLLFEIFGFRLTLWLAALVNALVALVAMSISRASGAEAPTDEAKPRADETWEREAGAEPVEALPRSLVLAAAFTTGFVFFLVELVWYRMSAPILGGTTYTFGLVLLFALLGIGAGGAAYAFVPPRRATSAAFALTCALEALFVIVPFALGDSVAIGAFWLRGFGAYGFVGMVAGWAAVCAALVLPAALVAGYQFPLLLALKGRGPDGVARDVGEVYAANTLGSVLGSLAGGFALVPWLGARGAWQLCALALVLLAFAATLTSRSARGGASLAAVVAVVAVVLCFATEGPTSLWRHSAIGAGRAEISGTSSNLLRAQRAYANDWVLEEHDGRESALAFTHSNGLTSLMSGKSDGNSYFDAPTQVGLGLVPALLHKDPKRAFVIGLGTGQTSGWLAQVPSIERVETAEIEPAMLRFGELCAASNENALDNEKVVMRIADGREAMLTSDEKFDIIASAPSNPYRAGLASFYSAEFYAHAADRLEDDGYFAQWMQGYEIDAVTLQLILRTMRGSFSHVTLWRLLPGDLLLLASKQPQQLDAQQLRERLSQPPFKRAFSRVWRAYDLEGVLAHFLADARFSAGLSNGAAEPNTDDRALLEFLFARHVGRAQSGDLQADIFNAAAARGLSRPALDGEVDWTRVARLRRRGYDAIERPVPDVPLADARRFDRFWPLFLGGQLERARAELDRQVPPPVHDLWAVALEAELMAHRPELEASFAVRLAVLEEGGDQVEAAWLRVIRALRTDAPEAQLVAATLAAIEHSRKDAWLDARRVLRSLSALRRRELSAAAATQIVDALLASPFAVYNNDIQRRDAAQSLSTQRHRPPLPSCVAAHASHVARSEYALRSRARCYAAHAKDLLPEAVAAVETWSAGRSRALESLLPDAK